VRPNANYSRLFPEQHACKVTVVLKDGRIFSKEKKDYEGFHTNPMSWDNVVRKFQLLSKPYTDASLRQDIVDAVAHLEGITVSELMELLASLYTREETDSRGG
jgi:2-methylcitrate dehydratase